MCNYKVLNTVNSQVITISSITSVIIEIADVLCIVKLRENWICTHFSKETRLLLNCF